MASLTLFMRVLVVVMHDTVLYLSVFVALRSFPSSFFEGWSLLSFSACLFFNLGSFAVTLSAFTNPVVVAARDGV
jgi:hypothetical protein